MLRGDLSGVLSTVITLVIAFTVHEFAHAWTADRLGDDTPRRSGRLTLNPLAHLDLLGSVMLLYAGFGWAKPVPINPLALRQRSPSGLMLVAAAGPLSNLLLALLASIPFQAGLVGLTAPAGQLLPNASSFLLTFISLNLVLLFFNLLPIAPLDGEKVLAYFLPASGQLTLERLRPYGPMILIGLILLGRFGQFNLLGTLIGVPAGNLLRLLIT
jgi:Zn-dependent protease